MFDRVFRRLWTEYDIMRASACIYLFSVGERKFVEKVNSVTMDILH